MAMMHLDTWVMYLASHLSGSRGRDSLGLRKQIWVGDVLVPAGHSLAGFAQPKLKTGTVRAPFWTGEAASREYIPACGPGIGA